MVIHLFSVSFVLAINHYPSYFSPLIHHPFVSNHHLHTTGPLHYHCSSLFSLHHHLPSTIVHHRDHQHCAQTSKITLFFLSYSSSSLFLFPFSFLHFPLVLQHPSPFLLRQVLTEPLSSPPSCLYLRLMILLPSFIFYISTTLYSKWNLIFFYFQ